VLCQDKIIVLLIDVSMSASRRTLECQRLDLGTCRALSSVKTWMI